MPEPYTLARRLGLGSATALVISNMIGTGIFTTTGFLAGDLGSPLLVLLSWVIGAACALLGAVCYSELAINFPYSGGEYVYVSHAYGKTWGFLNGWVSLVAGFSAPIAAAALAFANYVVFLFPAWRHRQSGTSFLQFGPEQLIACGTRRGILVAQLLRYSAHCVRAKCPHSVESGPAVHLRSRRTVPGAR